MAQTLTHWQWKLSTIRQNLERLAAGIRICFAFMPDRELLCMSDGQMIVVTAGQGRSLSLDKTHPQSAILPFGQTIREDSIFIPMCRQGNDVLLDIGIRDFTVVAGLEALHDTPTLRTPAWPPANTSSALWSCFHYYREDTKGPLKSRQQQFDTMKRKMAAIEALYDAIIDVCRQAPNTMLDTLGNVSLLGDWPAILHFLALRRIHPLLTTTWRPVMYPPSRETRVLLGLPRRPPSAVVRKFCTCYRYVAIVRPSDIVTATGYAFDAMEQIAGGRQQPPPHIIPPEERTIPLSYKRAAALMGKGRSKDAAEWLAASVKDGSIPCEHLTRQSHVFSRLFFPKDVWGQILPGSHGRR